MKKQYPLFLLNGVILIYAFYAYAQPSQITNIQTVSGESTFKLEAASGIKTVKEELTFLTYGELDCIIGFTIMGGAGYSPTRANCKTVNSSPSKIKIDQMKKQELTQSEKEVMYLIRQSVKSKISIMALDYTPNYGAENYHLHIMGIECSGPTTGIWKDFTCKVTTSYNQDEINRQPASTSAKETKTTRPTSNGKTTRNKN